MVVMTDLPPPEDGIKHRQARTRAVLDQTDLGTGTLFIAESCISWTSSQEGGRRFCLEYPHVSLHAVCRDLSSYPQACLYLVLDRRIQLPEAEGREGGGEQQGVEENDDDDGRDEDEESTEVRFVPEDEASLNPMYNAMCLCQTLHPDPDLTLSPESSSGEDDEEPEEEEEVPVNGHNGRSEMEVEEEEEGQFDDA